MKLGIAIQETWDFLHEIYADLKAQHQTSLFERRTFELPVFTARLNNHFLRQDLQAFMQANDVVFFEWASELLALASHLPKTCGIVTRLHRYEMYQWADQINWEAVDRIILVSEAKRREFASRFPAQAGKISVISEAVSLDRFTLGNKPFSGDIGTLCHLRPRKRVYELILAFYELSQFRDDLHLHIGGGEVSGLGEYPQALRVLVENLGLQKKISFHGHISNPQDWYHTIDVFISNSYSEGLQVSPIEAIASGCYCLSHFWDGADELLPRENLYYSERELTQKLLEYCETSEAEKEQRKTALRTRVIDNFDVDKTKIQIRQLIEAVAAARHETLRD